MDLIDFKDKFSRTKFFVSNIRYYRPKHLYISIFLIIIIAVISITVLFLKQKDEIRRKENILKSYYEKVNYSYKNQSAEENLSASENSTDKEPSSHAKIKVYICGYVNNPGVFEIEKESRIVDLLLLCGGETPEACLEVVNLAQKINDGDMIYIPSEEEIKDGTSALFTGGFVVKGTANTGAAKNSAITNIININTASKEELIILPGIGEQTAQNIIDYRNKYGFFKTREEIKNVKGIGEKKYEKIKDMITV